MRNKKKLFLIVIILVISAVLRFFNLMHDSPYFFNPDERNMANAISQFRLPNNPFQIPTCIISQFFPHQLDARRYALDANNCNLNPHFFAYGQFPLYLAFASDQISSVMLNSFQHLSPNSVRIPKQVRDDMLITSFPSAIFWLRFWSALSSTLTVLFVYLIINVIPTKRKRVEGSPAYARNSNKLRDSSTSLGMTPGVIAAIMAAFTPGLIQSAHFGTTESLLTFFFLASIYFSMKLIEIPHDKSFKKIFIHNSEFIILNSITIGLALGSKLTGAFFFIPPAISLFIRTWFIVRQRRMGLWPRLLDNLRIGLFIIMGSILVFIISSPYNLVEVESFRSAVWGYERDVATGKFEAFYTRQFVNTTPILFQSEKIFPYALGWPVFIFGTIGFVLICWKLIPVFIQSSVNRITYHVLRIKYKKIQFDILNTYYLILTTSFLAFFLPNAFLFAKWTRFMTPVFPIFSIFAVLGAQQIYNVVYYFIVKIQNSEFRVQNRNKKIINSKLQFLILNSTFLILAILPGIAFMSIYTRQDSRLTASYWIYDNIPANSYVLSETANVVDIPLGLNNNVNTITRNYNVISFDFYHMDQNRNLYEQLLDHLENADYIFIPSRRIFENYNKLPQRYPLTTKYHQLLFSGALGYEKVAEISSFPRLDFGIWILEFGDEQSEETYTVFDHPVIRIYRKVKPFTIDKYRLLFEN